MDMGYLLVVITNQSGIARGYYTEEDYFTLEEWMCEDLKSKGIEITRCYHCPHLPDGVVPQYSIKCQCRKPETGLYWQAAKELDLDMSACLAIGDRPLDLAIYRESGVTGILLSDTDAGGEDVVVCRNWSEIIRFMKTQK